MSGWMDMDLIRLKVSLIKPDRLLCANNGRITPSTTEASGKATL